MWLAYSDNMDNWIDSVKQPPSVTDEGSFRAGDINVLKVLHSFFVCVFLLVSVFIFGSFYFDKMYFCRVTLDLSVKPHPVN